MLIHSQGYLLCKHYLYIILLISKIVFPASQLTWRKILVCYHLLPKYIPYHLLTTHSLLFCLCPLVCWTTWVVFCLRAFVLCSVSNAVTQVARWLWPHPLWISSRLSLYQRSTLESLHKMSLSSAVPLYLHLALFFFIVQLPI